MFPLEELHDSLHNYSKSISFFSEIKCQRSDGYPFGVDMCLKYAGPMPSASEPCYLPCDDDCSFKEWGRWTSCPHNCEGDQVRKRKLIGEFGKGIGEEVKCNQIPELGIKLICEFGKGMEKRGNII